MIDFWAGESAADGAEKLGEPILGLSSSAAEEIAFDIYEQIDTISDALAVAICETSIKDVEEIRNQRADDARLTHDRGLIVDFPNMMINTPNFQHRTRLCLTVCQPGSQSKLWFRSQCVGVRKQEKFDPPIDITTKQLEAFFEEAVKLSQNGLAHLLRCYDSAIQTDLRKRLNRQKLTSKLKVDKQLYFKLFDSDRPDLENLYEKMETGGSFTEQLQKLLAEQDNDQPHPALLMAEMSSCVARGKAIDRIAKPGNNFQIRGYRNDDFQLGLFVRRAEMCNKVPTVEIITYVGVAYDPNAQNIEIRHSLSPAYRLSADIVASAVRRESFQPTM